MNKYSFSLWILLATDVDRPIGGVKQIYRFCEACRDLGVTATVIQQSDDFTPGWFSTTAPTISIKSFNSLQLNTELDILVIPETVVGSVSAFRPELRRIIFNQNSSYTFGVGDTSIFHPRALSEHYQKALHTFVISQYDYKFISSLFGIDSVRLSLLINPIEVDLFSHPSSKKRQVAFMPRKNPKHSLIVTSYLKSHPLLRGWEFVPIHKMNQTEVASVLRNSFFFLSFGHPEGFGLPVAEALACGCNVVGYSGIGGYELFQIGSKFSCATEISFGDYQQFIASVLNQVSIHDSDSDLISSHSRACSQAVRTHYCIEKFVSSLRLAFDKIQSSLVHL